MKSKKAIIIILIFITLLLGALLGIILYKQSNNEENEGYRTIKIFDYNGEVVVRRNENDIPVNTKGMNLKSGDSLYTYNDAYVALKLDEDKYIYISDNAIVRIYASGTKGNTKTSFYLEQGSIIGDIQNKLSEDESFDVYSSNTIMSIHGTSFGVSKKVNNGEATVSYTLYRGEASVHVIEKKEDGTYTSNVIPQTKDEVFEIKLKEENIVTEEEMNIFVEEINSDNTEKTLKIVTYETVEEAKENIKEIEIANDIITIEEKTEVATIISEIKEKDVEDTKKENDKKTEDKKEAIFVVNSYLGYYDGEKHSIKVEYDGTGTIQYSIDNITYQDQNYEFSDVGYYIVYIRVNEEGTITNSYGSIEIIAKEVEDVHYNKTVTYHDNYKVSEIDLPVYEGMNVEWKNPNQLVFVGENDVEYIVSKKNYITFTGIAKITVLKAEQVDTEYSQTITYFDGMKVSDLQRPSYLGASVSWVNPDEILNAGTHSIEYKVVKDNYNDFYGFATIIVEKASIIDIQYTKTVVYTEGLKVCDIDLPVYEGCAIAWTEPLQELKVGVHSIQYKVAKPNYEDLTAIATITVEKANITNIQYTKTVVYTDGMMAGNIDLPVYEGGLVVWTNPLQVLVTGVNKLEYRVIKENYNDLIATVTIMIEKANITDIQYTKTVVYSKGLKVKDVALPEYDNFDVAWSNKEQDLVIGENRIEYKVVKDNYNELTAVAIITVEKGSIDDIQYSITVDYVEGLKVSDITLPNYEGFTVSWVNGDQLLNAGEHAISYQVKNDNYRNLTASANIIVNKANLEEIKYTTSAVYTDDITVASVELPFYQDCVVSWVEASQKLEVGVNLANYKVIRDNYNDLIATAIITVQKGIIFEVAYQPAIDYFEALKVQDIALPTQKYPDCLLSWCTPNLELSAGTVNLEYLVSKENYNDLIAIATVTINKGTIEDINYTFEIIYYDGMTEQAIDKPYYDSATVSWINQNQTLTVGQNILEYKVVKDNYNDLIANSTVTVGKGIIEDINYSIRTPYRDSLLLSSIDLPVYDGAVVTWINGNQVLEMGVNQASYRVVKENYEELTATASITLYDDTIQDMNYECIVKYDEYKHAEDVPLPIYPGNVSWTNKDQELVIGENSIEYKVEIEGYQDLITTASVIVIGTIEYQIGSNEHIANGDFYSPSITVTTPGVTIWYSLDKNSYSDKPPKYSAVGEYTIYYSLVKNYYESAKGEITMILRKPVVTICPEEGTILYNQNYYTTENSFNVSPNETITLELSNYDTSLYEFLGWSENGYFKSNNIVETFTIVADTEIKPILMPKN